MQEFKIPLRPWQLELSDDTCLLRRAAFLNHSAHSLLLLFLHVQTPVNVKSYKIS
jgi:hypothetical protein